MQRDFRIDAARGIALFTIVLTHMPGHSWAHWTLRSYGFSDAAEAFVLLAGIAAGMAYGRPQVQSAWVLTTLRSGKLAGAHLLLTMGALSVAMIAAIFGADSLVQMHGMAPLAEGEPAYWAGVFLGSHQIGYVNILTLYVVLIALVPLFFWGFRISVPATLAMSALVWVIVGIWQISPVNWPSQGSWQFNPFAWQVLFAIGLAFGWRKANGRPIVLPRWTVPVAGAVLIGALLWRQLPMVAEAGRSGLEPVWDYAIGAHVLGFHKPSLGGMRLLHALALGCIIAQIPVFIRIAGSAAMAPFRSFGRHGLVLFCLGTLISFTGQVILLDGPSFVGRDTVIAITAFALLWAVAWALDQNVAQKKVARRAAKARAQEV